MRNVYKKWEINSAKMNKAICAEWDGKLRALSRLLAARTGTDERFFAFLGIEDKNGDHPGQMDEKIPVSFDTGIFFGLFSRFMLIGYTEIAHPESAASRASSARRLSSSDSARSSRPEPCPSSVAMKSSKIAGGYWSGTGVEPSLCSLMR